MGHGNENNTVHDLLEQINLRDDYIEYLEAKITQRNAFYHPFKMFHTDRSILLEQGSEKMTVREYIQYSKTNNIRGWSKTGWSFENLEKQTTGFSAPKDKTNVPGFWWNY